MNTRVKTTLFHISQLLLIIAILASGMPIKAEEIKGTVYLSPTPEIQTAPDFRREISKLSP